MRMRAVRTLAMVGLVAGAAFGAAQLALASTSQRADLGANGIGTISFGLPKAQAVSELRALFGAPTLRVTDTACGAPLTSCNHRGLGAARARARRDVKWQFLTIARSLARIETGEVHINNRCAATTIPARDAVSPTLRGGV